LGLLGRFSREPALVAGAALDPVGAGQLAELLARCLALLAVVTLESESLAALLAAAGRAYEAADQLDRRLQPLIEAGCRLPAALLAAGSGHLQAGLTRDPELADLAVDGLVSALVGPSQAALPGTTSSLSGQLAELYADGQPIVRARPDLDGAATDDQAGPPRSTADLMRALQARADVADGGGLVDVRTLDSPTGRCVIVNIAGTTAWNLDPRRTSPQASDFGTNLRGLANQSSVLQRGVVQALQRAGVRSSEPIMLVGHSQGGVVAAQLATELSATGQFRVTHLVTAGSPIGLASVPDSVSVLALENDGDLVPQLDGANNPDRGNWLTARVSRGGSTIAAKHAMATYRQGAIDLDRCQDPALRQWQAGAARFLSAHQVHTQVFQVRRAQ
ncbi:MAG: hypothetical protein ABI140_06080, partial [Jatrophihabitantaceae bacterium]